MADLYAWTDVTDPQSPAMIGEPGVLLDIAPQHAGLADADLRSLDQFADQVPSLVGRQLWLVQASAAPALGLGQVEAVPTYQANTEARVWTRSTVAVDKDQAGFDAAWDNRLAEVLASLASAAEAARMAFLTPGTGKALTYEAKRQEARAWAADSSPRTLTAYPFALAEACALGGGNPAVPADMSEVDEAGVQAVIDVYTARAVAYEGIGALIEARYQAAVAAATAAHAARNEAALAAALTVTWPTPGS